MLQVLMQTEAWHSTPLGQLLLWLLHHSRIVGNPYFGSFHHLQDHTLLDQALFWLIVYICVYIIVGVIESMDFSCPTPILCRRVCVKNGGEHTSEWLFEINP